MWCFQQNAVATVAIPPVAEEYRTWAGAGLVFTNGDLILCGYEPHKKIPAIYGIGGKRESTDTTYYHTAFREAFEEILGVGPPMTIVGALVGAAIPQKTIRVGGYIMVQYSFTDLLHFLDIMRRAGVRTPFYTKFPRAIEDLLLRRLHKLSTEMTHLCILPVVRPAPIVSRDLASDIESMVARQNRLPQ
jgi:hypothetical protein